MVTLLQRYKDVGEVHQRKMQKEKEKGLSSASENGKNDAASLSTSTSSSSSSFPASVWVDKVLFREVPIALSLVERAWTKENDKQAQKRMQKRMRGGETSPSTDGAREWTFGHPLHAASTLPTRGVSHSDGEEAVGSEGPTAVPAVCASSPTLHAAIPTAEVQGETPGGVGLSPFSRTPPLSPFPRFSPTLLVDLLEGLHEAESERRWSLQEKMAEMDRLADHHTRTLRQVQCRLRVLTQKERKLAEKRHKARESDFRRRLDRLTRKTTKKKEMARQGGTDAYGADGPREPLVPDEAAHGVKKKDPKNENEEAHTALVQAIHTLQQQRDNVLARQCENTEDAHLLLRHSLLARPYLTATLWRHLLRQEVWVAAMHNRSHSLSTPASSSSSSSSMVLSDATLLRLLWCWSRVVVGVLRDVVEGRQPLPSSSPRFVVSLPSRAYRRRCHSRRGGGKEDEGKSSSSSSISSLPPKSEPNGAGYPPQLTSPHHHVPSKRNPTSSVALLSASPVVEEEEEACMDEMIRMSIMGMLEETTPTNKEKCRRDTSTKEPQKHEKEAGGPSSPLAHSRPGPAAPPTPAVERTEAAVMGDARGTTPSGTPRKVAGRRRKRKHRHRIASPVPRSPVVSSSSPLALRWLPRPSRQLLPLLVETLALWRHLLGALQVEKLLQRGDDAGHSSSSSSSSSSALRMLVSLLVAVKEVATTTLLLGARDGPWTATTPSASTPSPSTVHTVLHALEEVVLDMVGNVRQQLHTTTSGPPSPPRRPHWHDAVAAAPSPVEPPNASATAIPLLLQGVSPLQAAQLLLQLQHLHALSPTSPAARCIVQQCGLVLFPQLRTHTWEVLMGRARQTSILAFISRSQHAKLHRRGARPESVLHDARQRSRLEQRRQAAALRGIHLSEMQRATLLHLAESLPPAELVELLQLFAAHLAISEENVEEEGGHRGGRRDVWRRRRRGEGQRGSRSSRQWRGGDGGASLPRTARASVLMATLLVAEAVFVADLLHPVDPSPPFSSSLSSASSLQLCHLADLWVVLAVLKPVVDASKAALPSSYSSLSTSASSSRSPLFHVLVTQVVQALQGSLATLVLGSSVEDHDGEEKKTKEEVRLPSDLALCLHKVAAGISRWEEESGGGGAGTNPPTTSSFSHHPLHREVQHLTEIMKEVFLAHSPALHAELHRRFPHRGTIKTSTGEGRSRESGRSAEEEAHRTGASVRRAEDGGEEVGGKTNSEVEGFKKNILHCFQRMSLLDAATERTVASF